MKRTIAALLAAASIVGAAAPASAQTKYYVRERLVGLTKSTTPPATTAPVTYSPTYSSSYGACTNNVKSKPITSCSASDKSPAKLSDCASYPQTTDAMSCGFSTCTMTPNTFAVYDDYSLPTQIPISSQTLTEARTKAKEVCEGTPGAMACLLVRTSDTGGSVYVYTKPYILFPGDSSGYYTGGACARK